MQLRNARLCLDCEEVHADESCPVCASERFAYLSRWVPVEERRQAQRLARQPASQEEPKRRLKKRWVAAGGVVGLAAFAAARLLLRTPEDESGSAGNGTGET